jgi:hypothetical protein
MFSSMIVYPIALAIGLIGGFVSGFVQWKRMLRVGAITAAIAAVIDALQFSMYFDASKIGETTFTIAVAALWCFVFAIAGFGCGAGARWFLVTTVRAFRGE